MRRSLLAVASLSLLMAGHAAASQAPTVVGVGINGEIHILESGPSAQARREMPAAAPAFKVAPVQQIAVESTRALVIDPGADANPEVAHRLLGAKRLLLYAQLMEVLTVTCEHHPATATESLRQCAYFYDALDADCVGTASCESYDSWKLRSASTGALAALTPASLQRQISSLRASPALAASRRKFNQETERMFPANEAVRLVRIRQ